MAKAAEPLEYIDTLTTFPDGVNSGVAAILLSKTQLSWAINSSVRGGFVGPRPPYQVQTFDFGGTNPAAIALKTAVTKGFFQGAGIYRPDFGPSQVIAVISGRIFTFTNTTGLVWQVKEVTITGDPMSATATQVWMWQSELWMIISDGSGSLPVFFDGVSCRRSYGPSVLLGSANAWAPTTPPAIGQTVQVTLTAPYTGPYNVPVNFNGALYEPTASGTPTPSYQVILTNTHATVGNIMPIGSTIVVNTGNYGYVNFFDTAYENSLPPPTTYWKAQIGISGNPTIAIGGTIQIATFQLGTNAPWPTNWTVTAIIPGVQPLYRIQRVKQEADAPQIRVDQLVTNPSNTAPNVIIANTTVPFTVPAIGGSVSVTIDALYSGVSGQTVWIGNDEYSISLPPPPVPGVTLSLINLTDTTTAAYASPQSVDITSVPEIPACRMGAYGLGQNWVSLTDGLQFVPSDINRASSGTQAYSYRDAVLKMTNALVFGTFGLPGTGNIITSMTFTAILDASLGQGALQIGTAAGFFSCKAPFDLTDFNATVNPMVNPILTDSLIGNGPQGQNSTILSNSDTLYRSNDGIGSLVLARRDFVYNSWGNTPISREVTRALAPDNPTLLNFGSAVIFGNRLRMTCAPNVSSQGVFHIGEVALNFDLVSSLRNKLPPAYDGLWTGLNVLQHVTGLFGPIQRTLSFSFNITNSVIELYELLPDGAQTKDNGTTPITWVFETPSIFNKDIKAIKELVRLIDGEIQVDNVIGQVDFEAFWKPDQYPCWVSWHKWSICAKEKTDAEPNLQPGFHPNMGLGEPSPKLCDEFTNRPFREFYTMQFKLVVSGNCRVISCKFLAVPTPQPKFAKPICIPVCAQVTQL